jgi:hypothetical protein
MSTATEMRDLYLAAEAAVLKGQSFRLGERQVTRADLAQIITGRKDWERRVSAEASAAAGNAGYAIADFSGRCDGHSFRVAD